MRLYGTEAAADLAGVTPRQVRFWMSTRRFRPTGPPHGSGSRAVFSELDVLRLRVIAKLLGYRINLDDAARAAVLADPGVGRWLVVCGAVAACADDPVPWVEGGSGVVLDLLALVLDGQGAVDADEG